MIFFEMVPLPKLVMISIAASAPLPEWIISFHLLPWGSAMIAGAPLKINGKNPMPSE
jgi:hypothetical protein